MARCAYLHHAFYHRSFATLQAADILLAVPEERQRQMQDAISRIWHRCGAFILA